MRCDTFTLIAARRIRVLFCFIASPNTYRKSSLDYCSCVVCCKFRCARSSRFIYPLRMRKLHLVPVTASTVYTQTHVHKHTDTETHRHRHNFIHTYTSKKLDDGATKSAPKKLRLVIRQRFESISFYFIFLLSHRISPNLIYLLWFLCLIVLFNNREIVSLPLNAKSPFNLYPK